MSRISSCRVLFTAAVALVVVLTGCGGIRSIKVDESAISYEENMKRREVAGEVLSKISDAVRFSEAGDCRKAISIFEELTESHRSVKQKMEILNLTAICLCYLQDGNIAAFMEAAERLDDLSRHSRNLPRQTQIVLSMRSKMTGSFDEGDPRIETRIENPLKEIFRGDNHD